MQAQFSLKDGRGYVHSSDIMAYVLQRFGVLAPDKIVIDFFRPTVSEVELVLRDKRADYAADGAVFAVKVIYGQTLEVYSALPLACQPILERVESSHCVVAEAYAAQAMEVTSSARKVSDFFMDLNTCLKRHWKDYSYQNRIPLIRRMELRLPFQVPTGVLIVGKFQKLKLGAQAWHFNAPAVPDFEFSVIGLHQDLSPAKK